MVYDFEIYAAFLVGYLVITPPSASGFSQGMKMG